MKLKIDHNCLRLRLTEDDLRELSAEGVLAETTVIGSPLTYALEPGDAPHVTATFIDGRINVVVPRDELRRWADGSDVAIEASQPPLRILIEKDLARGKHG